jgi:adenylosuccinate synthase
MDRLAYAIIDLLFGDSGKGTIVDFLSRRLESKLRLVVRFNGGAQAGHNVVTPDGLHHKFSQFGSGSLVPGVLSYLSEYMAVHPIALQIESEHLEKLGVVNPLSNLFINRRCLITTPYHQALNCLRELSRGDRRHGSCGVGFGETIDYAEHGTSITIGDCESESTLIKKLRIIRDRVYSDHIFLKWNDILSEESLEIRRKWTALIENDSKVEVIARVFGSVLKSAHIVDDVESERLIKSVDVVLFEGAQGVLLDESYGFAPYNTWSQTTGANLKSFSHLFDSPIPQIGVVRAYPTRHGLGPFPTHDRNLTAGLTDPYNPRNPWQGNLRVGWFDFVMLGYALKVCRLKGFPISGLAVTHLDQVSELGWWNYAHAYEDDDGHRMCPDLVGLKPEERTKLLFNSHPVYKSPGELSSSPNHSPYDVIETIEDLSKKKVWIKSSGPTAEDKVILKPMTMAFGGGTDQGESEK